MVHFHTRALLRCEVGATFQWLRPHDSLFRVARALDLEFEVEVGAQHLDQLGQ